MADQEQQESASSKTVSPEIESPAFPGKGFRIFDYTILETLGHGSMATVFLATDLTGHEVALKVFQEGPGVSKTMLERFHREAEASKKLRRHPNIITIYETGKEGPYHFIAMESVWGSKTLEDAMETAPLSLKDMIKLIIKICRALQYAHNRKVIHRDVKPTNIMIDEFGEALLTDFGVAALFDWPSCTVTGALTGTPLYMSPEQSRGDRVGPASDIYSLGVVLYEAVTGVMPYNLSRSSPVQVVLESVKTEAPRRPRLFRKEISPELEAVILKALAKNPNDRYVDAEAMAEDLERVLMGRSVSAQYFRHVDRIRFFLRRHKPVVIAGLMAVAAAVVLQHYFKNKVLDAQFQSILHLAHLKNTEIASRSPDLAGSLSQPPRALNEIRMARKAMLSRDWRKASTGLQQAVNLSSRVGDQRTVAVARLEQARCEIMLDHYDLALDLYSSILKNNDASPKVADLAKLEILSLTSLQRKREVGLQALLWREPPEDDAISIIIDTLRGEMEPEKLMAVTFNMPPDMRNDAYFAAALRYHLEKSNPKAVKALNRCLRTSRPLSEWPGPLARKVLGEWSG